MSNPSSVSLPDDGFSPSINIGFPFTFYGSTFNNLVIGSNGIVSFDTTNASGYCPWNITAGIPTNTYPMNSIMAPFMDMNPAQGGEILYETIGLAPNRKFIIYYKNVFLYSCALNCWSSVIVLNETSNILETHLHNKPLCTSWNSGYSIEGIQNADGTIAHAVTGRNYPDLWTVVSDGRSWTPTGATSYSVDSIAFQPVLDTSIFVHWENTLGDIFPYTDTIMTYVTSSQPVGYFLAVDTVQLCNIDNYVSDTSWINGGLSIGNEQIINEGCSGSQDGSYSFDILSGAAPFTIYWNGNLASQPSFPGLTAGTYTLEVSDNNGCTIYDTIEILGNNSLILTLVGTNPEIYGSDGSATFNASGGTAPYLFSIGGLAQSGTTFNNLVGGSYTCVVTDIVGCTDTIDFFIDSQVSLIDHELSTIRIYPNPAEKILTIDSGTETAMSLYIMDLSGKIRLEENIKGETAVDIRNLEQGTYILKLLTNEGNTYSDILIKM